MGGTRCTCMIKSCRQPVYCRQYTQRGHAIPYFGASAPSASSQLRCACMMKSCNQFIAGKTHSQVSWSYVKACSGAFITKCNLSQLRSAPMMKPCRQLIAGMTHLQVSQPDSGACSTQRIFSTEIRMHEIVQPVCCRQDALTGVSAATQR